MLKKSLSLAIIVIMAWSCQPAEEQETAREVKTYPIEAFMTNISIGAAGFSPDGSKVLVTSDKSGIINAYELTLESQEVSPITQSDSTSVRAVSYFPEDERIMLAMDDNGNEIFHLFVRETDGTVTELTTNPQARASFQGWSYDGSKGFFSYTNRDPRFADLYAMDVATLEYEMIYQNDEGYFLGGLSRDEEYLALIRPVTTSETELFLLHRPTGEMTEISTEMGSYSPAYFHPNEPALYYLTNAGAEYQRLMKYDYETDTHSDVAERDWDIAGAFMSREGTYQALIVNADGRSVVEMTHVPSGEKVDLPDAEGSSIGNIQISRDESQMTFMYGNSAAPFDLYHMPLPDGESTKLFETLNEAIAEEDLVQATVVRYPSFDDLKIPAIYYKPHQASAEDPVPALVWVHGGPGGQSRQGYFGLIQYLVNKGYAILAVNNRGSSGYGNTFFEMDNQRHGEEDLQDCVYGKKWLAQQPYIDSSRIGIIGGSYGGFMVMAALTREPEVFDVGVDIFGVTNWLRTLKSIPPWWEAQKEALYDEMGNPYEDSVRLYEISPLFHADQITKPTMVLQGAQDPRVLQAESDEIVAAIEANGVPVEYVLFPDEGHGFVKEENQIEGYGKIGEFLDTYLKGKKVMPEEQ